HDTKRSPAEHSAKCLGCHAPPSPAGPTGASAAARGSVKSQPAKTGSPARGTTTCPGSPASGCVACHMPPFPSEPLHATFTDHYIRVHPELNGETASRKPR